MTTSSIIRKRWLSNSVANLLGGFSAAAANILIPGLVVRHLTADGFAIWNLALQIMLYIGLFSLGLQTTMARAVAHAAESRTSGISHLSELVRAARSISKRASGLAILAGILIVIFYPFLFPSISAKEIYFFRVTLSLFALSAVAQILAQVEMGVFQGLHKNYIFITAQVAVRCITVFSVWLAVQNNYSLILLAAVVSITMALIWPIMRLLFALRIPWAKVIKIHEVNTLRRFELFKYSASLSVWSLSMILVNSTGTVIVGRINFQMAGSFGIAVTASTILAGLVSSILSPLITNAAALYGSADGRHKLPAVLEFSTVYLSLFLNLGYAVLLLVNGKLLSVWVGPSYVLKTAPLVLILIAAHCIRNLAAPYSLMLLAIGLHKRALTSSLIEGFSVLFLSIIFGSHWGAMGVAYAALCSSFIALTSTLLLNLRKTPILSPNPIRFAVKCLVLPNICLLPLQLILLFITIPYNS